MRQHEGELFGFGPARPAVGLPFGPRHVRTVPIFFVVIESQMISWTGSACALQFLIKALTVVNDLVRCNPWQARAVKQTL